MKASPAMGVVPQLDGLRGLGALLVFVFHFLSSIPYYGLTAPHGSLSLSTRFAVLSVDVFFAASGFILFGSLERVHAAAAERSAGVTQEFYLRRFFRIMPLWWLLLTIELFRQRLDPLVYLTNATFLFGFLSFDVRFLPILVAWTLFAEMSFYILLPAVFRWVRGVRTAVACFGLMVVLARAWQHFAPTLGVPASNHFIDDFPLSCFKYFALGILARFLLPRLPARASGWLDVGAIAGLAATGLTLRFETPATFLLLLAALSPGTRVGRWLTVKPLVFAGVHCYFIYLAHNQLFIEPMLDLTFRVLPRTPLTGSAGPWLALVAFLLGLALCLAVAAASMKVFEAPMMELGRRLGSRVRLGAMAAVGR